jgi:UDP-N-acetylglucosamine:LPS N-acetylglucosamine transferase
MMMKRLRPAAPPQQNRIAYFVSPHGFGHAARAAAVSQAVWDIDPTVQFEIFTTVPSWFFRESLSAPFTWHHLPTDVGLVQKSAFQADLNATVRSLKDFLPFPAALIAAIAARVKALNCRLIICDIAPMGVLVGKEIGIPSVLVENFTWDWIYQQYAPTDGRFNQYIDYLQSLFEAADYHIQTEPVCSPGQVALTASPVSRKEKTSAQKTKARLGLPAAAKIILITTGGIPQSYGFQAKLNKLQNIYFVMPGAGPQMKSRDNLIILPHHSDLYHPDLVNAADVVIGKAGYSTVAEVYHAGVPFGYVTRSNFRESGPLAAFIEREINCISMDEAEFASGDWIAKAENLLNLARRQPSRSNGADQIGRFIQNILSF